MRRRVKAGDRGRPPIPERFTYFHEADWPGEDHYTRWRAWGDAADAWAAEHRYTGIEMFEAAYPPTGSGGWFLPVDGRRGGPR